MSRRGDPATWISNWRRSDLPLPSRLIVTVRNLALRVVRRDTCCGNHGQPGC